MVLVFGLLKLSTQNVMPVTELRENCHIPWAAAGGAKKVPPSSAMALNYLEGMERIGLVSRYSDARVSSTVIQRHFCREREGNEELTLPGGGKKSSLAKRVLRGVFK